MEDDISKSTVVILVVLTVAVSMVGTWAVLNEISSPQEVLDGSPSGQVRLSIIDPDAHIGGNPAANANVGITIAESSS